MHMWIHTPRKPMKMLHRAGRITASNCFRFTRTSLERPSKSLLHQIMQFDTGMGSNNKYTQHGRKYEPVARAAYEEIFCRQHYNAKVVQTGFHVNANIPFLGASPDGLVSCSCHPDRVLEIKCPYKYQHGFSMWETDRDFPINAERQMKKNHQYFYQM